MPNGSRNRRTFLRLGVAVASLGLAGCPGDTDSSNTTAPGGGSGDGDSSGLGRDTDGGSGGGGTATPTMTPTATLTADGSPTRTAPPDETPTPTPPGTTIPPTETPTPTDSSPTPTPDGPTATPTPTVEAITPRDTLDAEEAATDRFGSEIAILGNTALVGAPKVETQAGENAGAVYVFTGRGGEWTQTNVLTPAEPDAEDRFGSSVALSRDTAVIGAARESANGVTSGSAYVFLRQSGRWRQADRLTPPQGGQDDRFGSAVAVDGNVALVAAGREEDTSDPPAGAVHVFEAQRGLWNHQARLVPNQTTANDGFGHAVEIVDDIAVIGAFAADTQRGSNSGAAYVFEAEGGSWRQKSRFVPSQASGNDRFGSSVAFDGDIGFVGAPGDDQPNGPGSGSVYQYLVERGVWAQQQKLSAIRGDEDDNFGSAVDIDGEMAVIGAPGDEDPNGPDAGSAYVFERRPAGWSQIVKLNYPGGRPGDQLGRVVGISGASVLVGSGPTTTAGDPRPGAAHIFDMTLYRQ